MNSPHVVIFNDTHGWHSEQLVAALTSHNITTTLADLAQCIIDLDHPIGIRIPGLDKILPDAVIVRGIAPGTLEQITLRMDVLHTLAESVFRYLIPLKPLNILSIKPELRSGYT